MISFYRPFSSFAPNLPAAKPTYAFRDLPVAKKMTFITSHMTSWKKEACRIALFVPTVFVLMGDVIFGIPFRMGIMNRRIRRENQEMQRRFEKWQEKTQWIQKIAIAASLSSVALPILLPSWERTNFIALTCSASILSYLVFSRLSRVSPKLNFFRGAAYGAEGLFFEIFWVHLLSLLIKKGSVIFSDNSLDMRTVKPPIMSIIEAILYECLIVPFIEEAIFRKLIPWIISKPIFFMSEEKKYQITRLISSILFGAAHLINTRNPIHSLPQAIGAGMGGYFLLFPICKEHGFAASVGAHASNNFIALLPFLIVYSQRQNPLIRFL